METDLYPDLKINGFAIIGTTILERVFSKQIVKLSVYSTFYFKGENIT